MKKLILAILGVVAIYFGLGQTDALRQFTVPPTTQVPTVSVGQVDKLSAAFAEQKSGIQVTGDGMVTKLFADDTEGSRHQRFILTLSSGQTLLVAHNIDLAPRLTSLKTGDSVAFNGVFEWNAKGGVVHWTHRDPSGRHQAGWLKHAGQTYQ
ncbi:MAG: DUF3465 domain-containing protein [Chromatiaceae bacterium]|nr:DUF3465 domain-containing protein [Chromatiaceae bacterium]